MKKFVVYFLFSIISFTSIQAQTVEPTSTTTIILVRHAEKMDDGTNNPDLTPKGLNRAIELQKVLTQEFEISAIFSTPLKRTQQTATPTAAFYSLDIQEYDHKKPTVLKELILSDYKGKTVLIAGHSNSTPILVNHFFGEDKYPYLSEDVFNQMFIVRIAEDGKVKVVQRSYGAENE
ncbi:MAG: phosphoglycerate mutase family protein [Balneolaceae bacterium]